MDPRQSTAHMLVATALVVSFAVTAVSQDWWLELQYYIQSRVAATPPAKPTNPNITDAGTIIKWMIGMGGSWIIFSLLVDLGDTAELGEALALLLMGTVLMVHGPQALTNLGLVQAKEAKVKSGG